MKKQLNNLATLGAVAALSLSSITYAGERNYVRNNGGASNYSRALSSARGDTVFRTKAWKMRSERGDRIEVSSARSERSDQTAKRSFDQRKS